MKLQIRTLSVQERKELYTQALEYFSKPLEERRRVGIFEIEGVCEYLCKIFIPESVCKVRYSDFPMHDKAHRELIKLVNTSPSVLPELYRRKKEGCDNYWFNNDNERLIALEDCLYDTAFLMEEEDEQGPTIFAEFEVDWEPAS